MRLFKTNPIDDLAWESGAITDIFTSTVEALTDVNKRALEIQDRKNEQILALDKEIDDLETIMKRNKTVVDKINSIFE